VNIPCLTSDDYVTVGGGEPAPIPVTASHPDIEEIYDEARALLHANGVDIQQRIGSGTYATVFAVARRRDVCVKLTLDVTEAAAVQTVLDAVAEASAHGHDLWDDLPALGKFHCVYALQLSLLPEGATMYAIVMDRYTRRPEPEVEEILDLRGRATEPDTLGQRTMEYICKKSRLPVHEDCTYGDARAYERVKAVLGPQLTRIEQTWKTLVGIGIEWFDLHSGNVMRDAEDNLRIIDLGRVWTTPKRIPKVGGHGTSERLPTRKRAPVLDEAAWENFASSSEANQESGQTLGQRMEAVAWEMGYEHASTRGQYAPYSKLAPFEPLARSVGVDLRREYDAGFEAFEGSKSERLPLPPEYPLQDPPMYAFSDYRSRGGILVWMSPERFLSLARALEIDSDSEGNIEDLMFLMQQGRRIDPSMLEISGDRVVTHDGRHRAHASKRLGFAEIPVLILDKDWKQVTADRLDNIKRERNREEDIADLLESRRLHGPSRGAWERLPAPRPLPDDDRIVVQTFPSTSTLYHGTNARNVESPRRPVWLAVNPEDASDYGKNVFQFRAERPLKLLWIHARFGFDTAAAVFGAPRKADSTRFLAKMLCKYGLDGYWWHDDLMPGREDIMVCSDVGLHAWAETYEPLAASTPNDKRALLLAAAKAHYEDDSEHFEGGCGDVAMALKAFADAIGLQSVEVAGGYGTLRKRGEKVYDEDEDEWYTATPEPVMHAWLTIDGERFDPTWEIVFGKTGAKYKADKAALEMVCDVPEPWLVNSHVESIYNRLVGEGWDLPPLNPPDEDGETREPLAVSERLQTHLLAAFEKYEYLSGTGPGFVLTNYEHRPPSIVRGHVTTYEEALRYAATELGHLEGASGRTEQSIAERESWVASLLRERDPLRSTLYVGLLNVNESQSRLGLGRALYAELEQWARSKGAGIAVCVSACFNDRESPLPFWRRLGFHVVYDRGTPEKEAVIEKEFLVSTSEALAASTPNDYPWLPLDEITPALPLMKRLGVSEVARSPRGFLAAYKRAKGDKRRVGTTPGSTPNREPYPWWQRRNEFVARHVGQIQATREPLWNRDGSPTKRHLALVAWAYSPDSKQWKKWLRDL
jgi:GNAT superfamily N-acetyltransferase